MSLADLVVYIPVMLQVRCVLVELLPVHTAHRIDHQVIVDVSGVYMGGDYNLEVWKFFLGQLQTNLIRLLRREFILI